MSFILRPPSPGFQPQPYFPLQTVLQNHAEGTKTGSLALRLALELEMGLDGPGKPLCFTLHRGPPHLKSERDFSSE